MFTATEKLDSTTAITLDAAISELIALAISDAKDGFTRAELVDLAIKAAIIAVEILKNATSPTGDPLPGVDKKSIAIEVLNRVLTAIEPYVTQSIIGFVATLLPVWARPIVAIVKLFWNPNVVASIRDRVPGLVQASFDGLKLIRDRRAA